MHGPQGITQTPGAAATRRARVPAAVEGAQVHSPSRAHQPPRPRALCPTARWPAEHLGPGGPTAGLTRREAGTIHAPQNLHPLLRRAPASQAVSLTRTPQEGRTDVSRKQRQAPLERKQEGPRPCARLPDRSASPHGGSRRQACQATGARGSGQATCMRKTSDSSTIKTKISVCTR